MQLKKLRGWLSLPCFVLAAWAETPANSARSLSLADCVQTALAHNRDIQIEQINPRIARLALDSAYGSYDPFFAADARRTSIADTGGLDPADLSKEAIYRAQGSQADVGISGLLPIGTTYTLGGDYAYSYGVRNFRNFDSYNVSAGVTVRQPLLRNAWIDQPRMVIQVNRKNLRVTELGVSYMVMDVMNRVHQAYYDLVFACENVRVQEKLLEVRQQFEAATRQQVQVGKLPDLEEMLARSEVARVQAELVSARNAVGLAENQLKTLLGDDFVSSVGVPLRPTERAGVVPQLFDLELSWQRGLTQRPDLAQMRLDVDKAGINVKYWHNQLFPSLDFVAGYGRRGSSTHPPRPEPASLTAAFDEIADGVAPNDMIGFIFSLPLSRVKERANYRAGKAVREQNLLRLKQREELILREIDDAIKNAKASLEGVHATRQAAEYAQAAVQAEEQKLQAGRSTPFVVLQLQGDLATAQSAEILARTGYQKALSQLYFAEGSTLERNGVSVELR